MQIFRQLVLLTKIHNYEYLTLWAHEGSWAVWIPTFLSRLWTPSPQLTPPNPHSPPCRLPEEICLYSVLLSMQFKGFIEFVSPFSPFFFSEGGCFYVVYFMHSCHHSFTFLYPLQGSVNTIGKAGHPLSVILPRTG